MDTHRPYLELLHQQADGELERLDRQKLERHLAGCADCRAEREALVRLEGLLAAERRQVRPGFRQELMARLPAAGWENRHPVSWAAGVALVVLLAAGAVALTRGAGLASTPVAGALVAVLDLFRSSLLAGFGLLSASWRGVGLALGRLLDGSWLNLAALVVLVLGLDLLFLRLLLHTRRVVADAGDGEEHEPHDTT